MLGEMMSKKRMRKKSHDNFQIRVKNDAVYGSLPFFLPWNGSFSTLIWLLSQMIFSLIIFLTFSWIWSSFATKLHTSWRILHWNGITSWSLIKKKWSTKPRRDVCIWLSFTIMQAISSSLNISSTVHWPSSLHFITISFVHSLLAVQKCWIEN